MNNIDNLIVIGIIAVTAIFSFKGFNDPVFFDRYKFNVGAIEKARQQDRMLTSAFLHGDIMHLIFNMYTFYFFSTFLLGYGVLFFFIVYFGAILAGNFLALWTHKNQPYYSAIGASGGVSGILFAAIILDSTIKIGIFPFPFQIWGWLFGIIYLAYSIYGMRSQLGNIGHEAHLGGAVFGVFCAVGFVWLFPNHPYVFFNFFYLILMLIPIAFLAYIVYKKK
ncbi:MAG: rhomboid family intramembrane serine protease [Flavobacteriaceae bacterium]|jgi:membrane associated rhomboid family serine protease|nr:rhomboid family intramembrane serine protease [Flavobacteriaceae bacterium]